MVAVNGELRSATLQLPAERAVAADDLTRGWKRGVAVIATQCFHAAKRPFPGPGGRDTVASQERDRT